MLFEPTCSCLGETTGMAGRFAATRSGLRLSVGGGPCRCFKDRIVVVALGAGVSGSSSRWLSCVLEIRGRFAEWLASDGWEDGASRVSVRFAATPESELFGLLERNTCFSPPKVARPALSGCRVCVEDAGASERAPLLEVPLLWSACDEMKLRRPTRNSSSNRPKARAALTNALSVGRDRTEQ